MKSILIRDLDPKIYSAIKKLAEMHHRSMQGELHAILERTVKMTPAEKEDELDLITVSTGNTSGWSREEMYGPESR
jgi:plasmid stability protein